MLLFHDCSIVVSGGLGLVLALLVFGSGFAFAHCDTMDGPVVAEARTALEKGNVTPVLKWVKKEHEAEVRAVFDKVLAARKRGSEAREVADMYFFETLVRLHRAGEGAPYEGLKPAGSVEPIVAKADAALASGNVDSLLTLLSKAMTDEMRKSFDRVIEARKHAGESVEAGREYVEAYVQFVHYVERLHDDIAEKESAHGAHGH